MVRAAITMAFPFSNNRLMRAQSFLWMHPICGIEPPNRVQRILVLVGLLPFPFIFFFSSGLLHFPRHCVWVGRAFVFLPYLDLIEVSPFRVRRDE